MLKTVLSVISIALVMLIGAGSLNRSRASSLKAGEQSASTAGTTPVEVTFDGLMIFRKVGDHYEVGILDDKTAQDHKTRITKTIEGRPTSVLEQPEINAILAKGIRWTLSVEKNGSRVPPDITARAHKPCSRIADTSSQEDLDHVFDFCWIMDLETDFHPKEELKIRAGHLKPIIELNNGELFTKFKYDELERFEGQNIYPLGFVSETLALRIDLHNDERLVLRVKNEKEVVVADYGLRTTIGIFNAPNGKKRKHANAPSHFPYYYDVFERISTKFDIRAKVNGMHPLNRFDANTPRAKDMKFPEDKFRVATFDDQACGAIYLGKSTGPLQ